MTRFRSFGRVFERLKRDVEAAASDEASHRCLDCDKLVYTERSTCPECGGELEAIGEESDRD